MTPVDPQIDWAADLARPPAVPEPLSFRPPRTINLEQLSYDAVAAVMNALNPDGGGFENEHDKKAFSNASIEIVERWEKLSPEERLTRANRNLRRYWQADRR